MPQRRILSLWFPRLAAERVLRAEPQLAEQPLAVVAEVRGALLLASLTRRPRRWGSAAAWRSAMRGPSAPISSPGRRRHGADGALPRRAAALGGQLHPLGAPRRSEALVLDITGCAHLFGGEAGLAARVEAEAAGFGLTLRLGLADTLGAAWAVARYAGAGSWPRRMPATPSTRRRAPPARGRRSGAGSAAGAAAGRRPRRAGRIVPPGETLAHIGPLPVAALRIAPARSRRCRRSACAGSPISPRCRGPSSPGGSVRRCAPGSTRRSAAPPSRCRRPAAAGLRAAADLSRPDRARGGRARRHRPAAAAALRPAAAAGRGARRVRLTLVRTDGRPERPRGRARPPRRPAGGDPAAPGAEARRDRRRLRHRA